MQKKLLTMAVAGALAAPALAVAQSTVEVYGTVNMAFGNFKYTEGTATPFNDGVAIPASVAGVAGLQSSVSKWDVANGASNYGLRARENLGGGLAAWIQIEQNAPLERSNDASWGPASRNSAIGMQGGFGNVFMGQWTTPWADLDSLWSVGTVGFWGPVTAIIGRRETTGVAPNPNCANTGHGVAGACNAVESGGGIGHAFWRRPSNAVFYQSPVMAGVQVKLAYQTNEGKATSTASSNSDASLWSGSVQWAGMGGRARIGAAMDRHKDFSSLGATDTGVRVTGGWNFGVIDVGFAIEQMKYKCKFGTLGYATAAGANTGNCAEDGDVKVKNMGLALAVPVGPGSIRASYAVAKDLEGPVAAAAGTGAPNSARLSQTGAKQYNIGYEHRFSKRTNVGIGYAKIDNEANAAIAWTGMPPNQTGNANTTLFGSDVSTFFVSMTHRF
jgi:predicted porin